MFPLDVPKIVCSNNVYNYIFIGTDEDVITKLLAGHSNEQRVEIASAFKTAYGEVWFHFVRIGLPRIP